MGLSKRIRFEVFKRDKFTCQYCGKTAPDVVLQVDHIEPKSKGGSDDILNLVTACRPCNAGKSDVPLDDDSAIAKRRAQLDELQERQEQLEMMIQWQRGLADLDSQAVDEIAQFWCDLVAWSGVTAHGKKKLARWVRKWGIKKVMESMRASVDGYLKFDTDGNPTEESAEHAFNKIGAICNMSEVEKEKPYLKDVFYVRGVLRNRFDYLNLPEARQLLETAFLLGGTKNELYGMACDASSWSRWRYMMDDYIESLQGDGEEGAA